MSGNTDDLAIVKEFLVESYENLDQLDQDLIVLEKGPPSTETLANIFRTIHTIKGTCGFMGFGKLESVAHVGENLFTKLPDGVINPNPEITTGLLGLIDAVREILGNIESTEEEGAGDYAELISTLTRLIETGENAKNEVIASTEAVIEQACQPQAAKDKSAETTKDEDENEEEPRLGDILIQSGKVKPEQVAEAIQGQSTGDPRHIGEILVEKGSARPEEVKDALQQQISSRSSTVVDSNIRVDVGLLDTLMNRVGELVLTRNQILQFMMAQDDPAFVITSQRLNLITTELQENVMKTRMQPIGNIWNKFPRVVRDLALALNPFSAVLASVG